MKRNVFRILALVLAIAMMAMCFAACGGQQEEYVDAPVSSRNEDSDHPVGGILKQAYYQLSPTWDPYGQASWTTYIWAQNVVENCLVRGADGQIYPLVCEYEYPEDGLWISLWVRDGVCFSDGTEVTIEDVLASLERAALFTAGVQTDLWDNVESYDIEDGVLTFYFNRFNTATMEVLCSPRPCWGGVMPKDICEKYGSDLISDPADCIGTGPYVLSAEDSIIGEEVVLTRNEYYVACEASPDDNGMASPRRQYLDGIKIVKNGDVNSKLMSVMSYELDVIDTSEATYTELLEAEGLASEWHSNLGAIYSFFNCSESRITSDPNFRKAIAAAIDFDEFGYAQSLMDSELCSPVNCGDAYSTQMFTNADWYNGRKANVELAKQCLANSSYSGESLKIVANTEGGLPVMVQHLAAVGINAEYQVLDNATCIEYANDESQDWDMIYRANPTTNTNPGDMHSTFYQTWNNPRADELVELLKGCATGSDESITYWEELAMLMVEEVPFIIYGGNVEYYAYNPDLNLNREGSWQFFFNAYWNNPEEHMNWE